VVFSYNPLPIDVNDLVQTLFNPPYRP
jgi:hypothetical protein